jgi:hypothetical protein
MQGARPQVGFQLVRLYIACAANASVLVRIAPPLVYCYCCGDLGPRTYFELTPSTTVKPKLTGGECLHSRSGTFREGASKRPACHFRQAAPCMHMHPNGAPHDVGVVVLGSFCAHTMMRAYHAYCWSPSSAAFVGLFPRPTFPIPQNCCGFYSHQKPSPLVPCIATTSALSRRHQPVSITSTARTDRMLLRSAPSSR